MSWYHLVLRQVHEFKNVISSSFRSLVFLLLHWSDLHEGAKKRQQALFNLTPAVCPKYRLQWYVCSPTRLQHPPSCRSLALTVFLRGRWPPWLCCDSHAPRLPRLFPHCHCGSYSITLKIKPFQCTGLNHVWRWPTEGGAGRQTPLSQGQMSWRSYKTPQPPVAHPEMFNVQVMEKFQW